MLNWDKTFNINLSPELRMYYLFLKLNWSGRKTDFVIRAWNFNTFLNFKAKQADKSRRHGHLELKIYKYVVRLWGGNIGSLLFIHPSN